ncbi:YrhK family protein [Microbulbifer litoralis]|uniref:YrhK family protein n=1 Tax=Microbulbifer litoralis TaxID=2933965 RepID=UPI003CE4C5B5
MIEKLHNLLGVVSSIAFLSGSILFLPNFSQYAVAGVWLFALGSLLMLMTTAHNTLRSWR